MRITEMKTEISDTELSDIEQHQGQSKNKAFLSTRDTVRSREDNLEEIFNTVTERWGLERTSLILTPEKNIKFARAVKRVAKLGIPFEQVIAHSNQSILRRLTWGRGRRGPPHLSETDLNEILLDAPDAMDVTAKEAVHHGMVFDDLGFLYQLSSGELPSRPTTSRDEDTTLVTGHGSVLPFTTPKIFQRSTATPKAHLPDVSQQQEVNEAVSGVVPTRRLRAIQPLMPFVEDKAIADIRTAQSASPPKVTEHIATQEATISFTSPTGSPKDELYCQEASEEADWYASDLAAKQAAIKQLLSTWLEEEEGNRRDLERESSVILESEEAGKLFIRLLQDRLLDASYDVTAEAIARADSIYGDPGGSFEPVAARRQLL